MRTNYSIIIIVIIISISFKCRAQYEELAVGDTLPDITFNVFNYQSKQVKLSDFRGKIIILDFWSTFCTPCIASFPKTDSLQKLFVNTIQVFTVADQENAEVIIPAFWKKNHITKKTALPTIIDDKQILKKMFPRGGVPFVVWIDTKGVVKAMTSNQYITKDNLERVIKGDKIEWATVSKKKIRLDYSSLFLSPNEKLVKDMPVQYYSVLTNHLTGVSPKSALLVDSIKDYIRYFIVNSSILSLYTATLQRSDLYLKPNRYILDIRDSAKVIYNEKKDFYEMWLQKNSYCYESIMPISTSADQLFYNMRIDLNKYLGFNGRVEKRMVPCLVLKTEDELAFSKGKLFHSTALNLRGSKYTSISKLVEDLNMQAENPPIIDETGMSSNESVSINVEYEKLKDVKAIKERLKMYGLKLVESVRELDMFVLSNQLRVDK